MAIANSKDQTIKNAAEQYVKSNLARNMQDAKLVVDPKIADDKSELTVDLEYYWEPFLLHYFSDSVLPIRVSATASLAGSENLCVIALDPDNSASLAMTGKSSITANECAVYSNSVISFTPAPCISPPPPPFHYPTSFTPVTPHLF